MISEIKTAPLRFRNLPVDLLLVALALVFVVAIVALISKPAGQAGWPWPLIYLPFVAAALFPLSPRFRSLVMSPLFLLGVISSLFYLIPAWVWSYSPIEPIHHMSATRAALYRRFVGQEGQLVILQFSALSLLTAIASMRFRRFFCSFAIRHDLKLASGAAASSLAAVAVGVILCSAAILVAFHIFGTPAERTTTGVSSQLHHAAAPLMSAGVILLVSLAVGRTAGWAALAVGGLTVGCAALMATSIAAKAAVYIALSALVYFLVYGNLSRRRVVAVCAGIASLVTAMLIVLSVMRFPTMMDQDFGAFAYQTLEGKLLLRQAETTGCLQGVIEQTAPQGQYDSPFYFAQILIPRAVWPEKPNFSLGNQYATEYCAIIDPNPRHSASITLLGQPIIHAGWTGLAVAQASLVIGLLCVGWLAARTQPIGPVVLASLLPWLIDFDQSFAMYLGNAVKNFLVMLPIFFAVRFFAGRRGALVGPEP